MTVRKFKCCDLIFEAVLLILLSTYSIAAIKLPVHTDLKPASKNSHIATTVLLYLRLMYT
jgi:hypothetical protein